MVDVSPKWGDNQRRNNKIFDNQVLIIALNANNYNKW